MIGIKRRPADHQQRAFRRREAKRLGRELGSEGIDAFLETKQPFFAFNPNPH